MFPMLVLLVPIFDTMRVMVLRTLSGKNPFRADTNHIHHLLLRAGFSQRKSAILLWSVTFIMGFVAIALYFRGTSMPYLIVVLAVSIFLSLLSESLTKTGVRVMGHGSREIAPKSTSDASAKAQAGRAEVPDSNFNEARRAG